MKERPTQATCSYERNGETFTGAILLDQPLVWDGKPYWRYGAEWGARPDTSQPFPRCPYGVVGDGPWVKEAYRIIADDHDNRAVTGMRVERLQDITQQDVMAEGHPSPVGGLNRQTVEALEYSSTGMAAIEWFIDRWDAINAKRGYPWASNPWVWAPTFERV